VDLRVCCEPNRGATFDEVLAAARAAERAGFSGFFRSDHYAATDLSLGKPGSTDAWVTLGAIARETSTIRLGTLVSPVTFRLPAPLALIVSQVDVMSGGRVELGLGSGWFREEHEAFGIPFPDAPTRFDMLSEQLEIITNIWSTSEDERYSFTGQHYRLVGCPALPKPVQVPGPPIILGGSGRARGLALASAYASEFNVPFRPTAETVQILDRFRRYVEDLGIGREITLSAAQVVCVGRGKSELTRLATEFGISEESLSRSSLCGSHDEVANQLGILAEAGLRRLYIAVPDLQRLDFLDYIMPEISALNMA